MEERERYQKWIQQRKKVHIPKHFVCCVMEDIRHYETSKPEWPGVDRYFGQGSFLWRFMHVVLALGMSALGLFRISHVAFNLLYP